MSSDSYSCKVLLRVSDPLCSDQVGFPAVSQADQLLHPFFRVGSLLNQSNFRLQLFYLQVVTLLD